MTAATQEAIDRTKKLFHKPASDISQRNTAGNNAQLNVAAYLDHYGISYKIKSNGTGALYCLEHCIFDDSHTGNESAIIQQPGGMLLYQCFHNSCKGHTWAEARQIISGDEKLGAFMVGGSAPLRETRGNSESETGPEIEMVTMLDIREMKIEFPPPLIDGLLEASDSLLLTGSSGLGKSLMVLAIALAVAIGRTLFNQFAIPHARRVLLLQSENSLKATRNRITALLEAYESSPDYGVYKKGLDKIFTTMVGDDCRISGNLMDPTFLNTLTDIIDSVKPGLLILDPLISFHSGSENDNVEMRSLLDTLTKVASERHVAVLVVHHHGKGDHREANQSRGATAITDWARGILTLNRRKHEHKTLIKVNHTKAGNFASAKPFLLEVDGPKVMAVEQDIICPPSRVAEILADLGGEVNSMNKLVNEIVDICEVSRKTAQDAIEKAEEFGKIEIDKSQKAFIIRLVDTDRTDRSG